MVRTRVGYTGGTKADPTYHSLGDHTETVEVVYNPDVVSYETLLKFFWESHDPVSRPWSRQYMAAIFYHDDIQKSLAVRSKQDVEADRGRQIHTEILPATRFYPAEDYHQKYYLKHRAELKSLFGERFGTESEFMDSTVAARLNGLKGKHGVVKAFQEEMMELGFSAEEIRKALAIIGIKANRQTPGSGKLLQGTCPVVSTE